ncbi:macoilin-1 isoform X2 [Nymphalis io]|uniref:macoilin-1 isoform X2 n=1 Tax=Inachis io TaxID=171585 RepID=UPI002166F7E2|nr:macoilin-1 isoform X2 [Nymphalis io]
MKRRNAESGKRRPIKRNKIGEGMYANSLLYLKFVMLWATVIMADYMLEFRFEFLWPFWMMLKSVYDSFKYHGVAFSVFFICIALMSDLLCFFFIPLQYILFAAGTYVWVQYVWYTFGDKGICLPTVALCCLVVYAEGAVRVRAGSLELWRPLAAHCLGYPALSLGFGVKAYVGQRLRLRRQRQVRAENEFYFQLLRDALPESALIEQNMQSSKETECKSGEFTQTQTQTQSDARHMNGSVRRRCARDHNGVCVADHALHVKLEKLEKHVAQQTRDKATANTQASTQANTQASTQSSTQTSGPASTQAGAHSLSNGAASGPGAPDDDERPDLGKGSGKSTKCEKKEASSVREEKKKHKNREKDKDSSDSHKSTETKEILVKEKEVESTKEYVKSNKDSNSHKEREKEKERREERERENRERDRERELREKESRSCRELAEELRRARAELAAARAAEHDARRRALLQHSERGALERRLSDERRARAAAEHQLLRARHTPRPTTAECESEWCRSRRTAQEAETGALRRELQKTRERAAQLQRDLACASEQVRTLETRASREESGGGARLAGACAALQERAAHLERSLSAETRVKLDLLSALGDAKRHMHIQEGLISRQEKEIEELKAQMLAVMPTEFVTPVSGSVSKLRLSDGSPLDPNASVYTPKQLCSDA